MLFVENLDNSISDVPAVPPSAVLWYPDNPAFHAGYEDCGVAVEVWKRDGELPELRITSIAFVGGQKEVDRRRFAISQGGMQI
jgi:hypothetical protein